MILLHNIVFYSLSIIATIVMSLLGLVAAVFIGPFLSRRKRLELMRKAILVYGWILIKYLPALFIKIECREQEKRPEGACVYVANHRSSSDAFLMAALRTEAVQIVNTWPFRIPILGQVARLAEYLSVHEMDFESFLERGTALLNEGVSIAGFPEGTRSGNKELGSFKGGMFRLAQHAKVPIVPICIMGNEDKPKHGSILLHPGTIEIHRLKAVAYEEFKDMTPFVLKKYIRTIISDYIREHEQ